MLNVPYRTYLPRTAKREAPARSFGVHLKAYLKSVGKRADRCLRKGLKLMAYPYGTRAWREKVRVWMKISNEDLREVKAGNRLQRMLLL
jgi:hypothetical protein